jgi:hypothetical protein
MLNFSEMFGLGKTAANAEKLVTMTPAEKSLWQNLRQARKELAQPKDKFSKGLEPLSGLKASAAEPQITNKQVTFERSELHVSDRPTSHANSEVVTSNDSNQIPERYTQNHQQVPTHSDEIDSEVVSLQLPTLKNQKVLKSLPSYKTAISISEPSYKLLPPENSLLTRQQDSKLIIDETNSKFIMPPSSKKQGISVEQHIDHTEPNTIERIPECYREYQQQVPTHDSELSFFREAQLDEQPPLSRPQGGGETTPKYLSKDVPGLANSDLDQNDIHELSSVNYDRGPYELEDTSLTKEAIYELPTKVSDGELCELPIDGHEITYEQRQETLSAQIKEMLKDVQP